MTAFARLPPRLSICIPTYNFGAFLGETLASIVHQASAEVEILVVDGASTDDTPQVVARVARECPQLRYHRLERRGGIDRDIAAAVALARGEYCWLFAGDDLMVDGALVDVLAQIGEGHDVYLCESVLCCLDLTPIGKHRLLGSGAARVFELADPAQRAEYFALARNTAAFFSFCSSLVFRRARWEAVPLDEAFVGSCWAHVARFFRLLPGGLRVKYLPEPHLLKRGENDSFMERGLVDRYRITIEGFGRLGDTFFGHHSDEARHLRRCVQAEHNLKALLDAKLTSHRQGRADEVVVLDRLAETLYVDGAPSIRLKRWVYRHSPVVVLGLARPVYRLLQVASTWARGRTGWSGRRLQPGGQPGGSPR